MAVPLSQPIVPFGRRGYTIGAVHNSRRWSSP